MDSRTLLTSSWVLIGGVFGLAPDSGNATAEHTPQLMLANVYDDVDIDISQYWVSEKYDGVRAYWDGEKLWTRHGKVINAPPWFTRQLPRVPLDGELWAGRNRFELASSTVLDALAHDDSWREIRFMIFDLPTDTRTFDQRLAALNAMQSVLSPVARIVPQHRISSRDELLNELHRIVAQGGEGLMLHRGKSLYRGERTDDLLKMKPARDAEAKVIGYSPGKGKYAGMIGALIVETPEALRFSVGSGLSDADRIDPPKIGTRITYRYQTLTANGVPRFARYVRAASTGK